MSNVFSFSIRSIKKKEIVDLFLCSSLGWLYLMLAIFYLYMLLFYFLRQGHALSHRLAVNLQHSCFCLLSVGIIGEKQYHRSTPPTMHSQIIFI